MKVLFYIFILILLLLLITILTNHLGLALKIANLLFFVLVLSVFFYIVQIKIKE